MGILDKLSLRFQKVFLYRGLRIPLALVLKTGGGTENFEEIASHHLHRLGQELKFAEGDRLLEIGCGIGRDAINFLNFDPRIGSYLGIDIIGDSVSWCQENITKVDQRFRFHHFNIKDSLHNPGGSMKMHEVTIPTESDSVDKVFGWSVFTHMTEEDIRSYLREIKRVMNPAGIAFFSFFLVTDKILKKASEVNLTPYNLKFEFEFGDSCFINDIDNPMGAVAYTPDLIDKILIEEGFERVGDFHQGAWSGFWDAPKDGQDGVTFKHAARKLE